MAKKAKEIKLADFPEEVDEATGMKVYGELSYETQMAVLSQYLHNGGTDAERGEIVEAVRDFLARKHVRQDVVDVASDEDVWRVAEDPLQYDLFNDFFDVPFPAPEHPKFTFIDLFAGIGGFRIAMQNLGGKCVYSSEFDAKAQESYFANYGEMPFGDITKDITKKYIPEHFDILCAGFPCQAFSIIGKKEGFENETCGTLFFEIEKILKAKMPKAFILENVRNLTAHDNGNTFKVIRSHLEALGYNVYSKVLNALDYGVPQKRERIIIVGFKDNVSFSFPEPVPLSQRKKLKDILETDVDPKYYVREQIRESRLTRLKDPNYPKPYISHENMAGSITPHSYSSCLRAGASANYILINDERRPTEREMLRLQGFPENFRIVVSYGQIKHQTGNAVAVPVIKAVASQMLKSLEQFNLKQYDDKTKSKRVS